MDYVEIDSGFLDFFKKTFSKVSNYFKNIFKKSKIGKQLTRQKDNQIRRIRKQANRKYEQSDNESQRKNIRIQERKAIEKIERKYEKEIRKFENESKLKTKYSRNKISKMNFTEEHLDPQKIHDDNIKYIVQEFIFQKKKNKSKDKEKLKIINENKEVIESRINEEIKELVIKKDKIYEEIIKNTEDEKFKKVMNNAGYHKIPNNGTKESMIHILFTKHHNHIDKLISANDIRKLKLLTKQIKILENYIKLLNK